MHTDSAPKTQKTSTALMSAKQSTSSQILNSPGSVLTNLVVIDIISSLHPQCEILSYTKQVYTPPRVSSVLYCSPGSLSLNVPRDHLSECEGSCVTVSKMKSAVGRAQITYYLRLFS